MIKKSTLFLLLFITTSLFSQEVNFDKFQYIIVSDKFDFVSETDQYQTSSLTKFLLRKKGFKVFLTNDNLPEEITQNRCNALFATVNQESSMFTIKNSIEIKDCYGKILYTSQVGKSKEKEYKKGYQEAIRNAFETMTDFNYSYNPTLVEAKKEVVVAKNSTDDVVESVKKTPVVIATPEVTITPNKEITAVSTTLDVLYSQPKNNGFQLVNTKPEVVFVILKTNVKEVFIIDGKNGIFYKVGQNWMAEYYENGQLITKEYQVKF